MGRMHWGSIYFYRHRAITSLNYQFPKWWFTTHHKTREEPFSLKGNGPEMGAQTTLQRSCVTGTQVLLALLGSGCTGLRKVLGGWQSPLRAFLLQTSPQTQWCQLGIPNSSPCPHQDFLQSQSLSRTFSKELSPRNFPPSKQPCEVVYDDSDWAHSPELDGERRFEFGSCRSYFNQLTFPSLFFSGMKQTVAAGMPSGTHIQKVFPSLLSLLIQNAACRFLGIFWKLRPIPCSFSSLAGDILKKKILTCHEIL